MMEKMVTNMRLMAIEDVVDTHNNIMVTGPTPNNNRIARKRMQMAISRGVKPQMAKDDGSKVVLLVR